MSRKKPMELSMAETIEELTELHRKEIKKREHYCGSIACGICGDTEATMHCAGEAAQYLRHLCDTNEAGRSELFSKLCEAFLIWDDMDPEFLADNGTFLLTEIENYAKMIREYQKKLQEGNK